MYMYIDSIVVNDIKYRYLIIICRRRSRKGDIEMALFIRPSVRPFAEVLQYLRIGLHQFIETWYAYTYIRKCHTPNFIKIHQSVVELSSL